MKLLFLINKRKYGQTGRGYYVGWFEELFREEVIRTSKFDVYPFGSGYCDDEVSSGKSLPEKVEELGGVDVILTSYSLQIDPLFNDIDALKVNIAKDFYDGKHKINRYYKHYKKMSYNVIFGYASVIVDKFRREKIGEHHHLLPFGVDTGIHRKLGVEKKYDAITCFTIASAPGTNVYSDRIDIRDMVRKVTVSSSVRSTYFHDMVKIVNEAKICINHSPVPVVNPRVTEVLACGTFLLTNYCNDFTDLGYKDGKHLVFYNGLDDLADKINYYLENDDKREKIASSGRKFVRKYYNNSRRVGSMSRVIRKYL